MNIAISTIIILILILPGITFRKLYFSEEFSSQYVTKNLFELIITTVLPSIFLHAVALYLSFLFCKKDIDFEILGQLLTSKDYPEKAFQNINSYKIYILSYLILSLSISSLLGYLLRKLIRLGFLDSKYKLLRFQNSWHYIVTGEFFNFSKASFNISKKQIKSIDVTHVNALISTSEGTVIYDGYLVDYKLSGKDDLKYITIKDAERRFLTDDKKNLSNNNKYYSIPGHVLVIPNNQILNLNFSYYQFAEDDNGLNLKLVK